MSIFSFGYYVDGKPFKVLNERHVRANSGVMLLIGSIASINGFILKNYEIIPYLTGFIMLSFLIGALINPKFAPTMFIGHIFVRKQAPIYIGAIQKKFSYTLGSLLSMYIFTMSLFLQSDETYFDTVCFWCIICLLLLFLETAFGICIGCKMYKLAIRFKLLPKPTERPNCIGDNCEV